MKIIEVNQNGWQRRRCTGEGNSNIGCGSILLLDIDDVIVSHHTCFDGSVDTYYSFICPVCYAMTDIPPEELPTTLKSENGCAKVKKKLWRSRRI